MAPMISAAGADRSRERCPEHTGNAERLAWRTFRSSSDDSDSLPARPKPIQLGVSSPRPAEERACCDCVSES